jgi:hypothetical protein
LSHVISLGVHIMTIAKRFAALAALAACLAVSAPCLAAGLDSSLFLRQCQPYFDRLAALDGRFKPADPASDDARLAREFGLIGRLAGEYLIGAKNMIAVFKASPAAASEDVEAYLRAQLTFYAQKLSLDATAVETALPGASGAELTTAGSDLLKMLRQLRDFYLAAAQAAPGQGGGK